MNSLIIVMLCLAVAVLVLAVLALASLTPHAGVVLCLTIMLVAMAEVQPLEV